LVHLRRNRRTTRAQEGSSGNRERPRCIRKLDQFFVLSGQFLCPALFMVYGPVFHFHFPILLFPWQTNSGWNYGIWYMQIFMAIYGDLVRGMGVSCCEDLSRRTLGRIRKVDHVFCSHCTLFSLR